MSDYDWRPDVELVSVKRLGSKFVQPMNRLGAYITNLEADLTAANERARVAEAERDFERKVSEWLAKRGRACLGMPECDVFFEEREDKPECKQCWRDALAAAREALRSDGSDTAPE